MCEMRCRKDACAEVLGPTVLSSSSRLSLRSWKMKGAGMGSDLRLRSKTCFVEAHRGEGKWEVEIECYIEQ